MCKEAGKPRDAAVTRFIQRTLRCPPLPVTQVCGAVADPLRGGPRFESQLFLPVAYVRCTGKPELPFRQLGRCVCPRETWKPKESSPVTCLALSAVSDDTMR